MFVWGVGGMVSGAVSGLLVRYQPDTKAILWVKLSRSLCRSIGLKMPPPQIPPSACPPITMISKNGNRGRSRRRLGPEFEAAIAELEAMSDEAIAAEFRRILHPD